MLSTRQKLALAAGASRTLGLLRRIAGRDQRVVVRRGGVRWALDLDEGIDLSIYLLGRFERRTLAACLARLRPGDTVLDIGANVGAYTLPLARHVAPHGRVVAFEPTDYAFAKLTKNLRLNPDLARAVTAAQVMLGDTSAGAVPPLYSSWPLGAVPGEEDSPLPGGIENGRSTSAPAEGQVHPQHGGRLMSTGGAFAMTLDQYLEEAGIERIRLVKLDVDGHECRVLRGARQSLCRTRPLLVMELAPYTLSGAGDSVEELLDLLGSLGYRLTSLFSGAPLPLEPTAIRAMIPDGHSVNVLGTPHGDSRHSSRGLD